jgi:hypothetical protein
MTQRVRTFTVTSARLSIPAFVMQTHQDLGDELIVGSTESSIALSVHATRVVRKCIHHAQASPQLHPYFPRSEHCTMASLRPLARIGQATAMAANAPRSLHARMNRVRAPVPIGS